MFFNILSEEHRSVNGRKVFQDSLLDIPLAQSTCPQKSQLTAIYHINVGLQLSQYQC